MTKSNTPLDVQLCDDRVVINNNLVITFLRTIRVPDNQQVSDLPPDLGEFPLKSVSAYASSMPRAVVAKGGVFLPMYQSEAMWINFSTNGERAYMIKIYVGGINVISGEPAIEDADTKSRRRAKLAKAREDGSAGFPLQDYIVVPNQRWLDGIATSDGSVRQFVATPLSSGHSVESQITGRDAAGGIQFEVTPYRWNETGSPTYNYEMPYGEGSRDLTIQLLTGHKLLLKVESFSSFGQVMDMIQQIIDVPQGKQRLLFEGQRVLSSETLADHDIQSGSTIDLVLELSGGGCPPQLCIAAGGSVRQTICADRLDDDWLRNRTTVFSVQILNSLAYRAVTGESPPSQPLDAETYASYGFPFFEMYEEPTGIHGDFENVRSVATLEDRVEDEVEPHTIRFVSRNSMFETPDSEDSLINPEGPLRGFRSVHDLKKEYLGYHVARFQPHVSKRACAIVYGGGTARGNKNVM